MNAMKRQVTTTTTRRFRQAVALRVLTPSAVLACVVAAAIVLFVPPKKILNTPEDRARQPAFAQVDTAELVKVFNSSMTVVRQNHLRRSELAPTLAWLEDGYFNNIRTQADLKQSLNQLVIESKDPYAAVLTLEEYNHLVAREGGAEVGVKLKYSHESKINAWVVSEVPKGSPAELEGVEKGDVIVTIDGLDGSTFKSSTMIDNLLAQGFLGSRVPFTFRRQTEVFEVELPREVVNVESPTSLNSSSSLPTGVQTLEVKNLQHPDVIKDVITHLKALDGTDVKNTGLILDLNKAGIATGETAARLAALFIEKGVICHYIRTSGDNHLEVCRWEVRQDGKAVHVVKGPFKVDAQGKIDRTSAVAETVEVLDWPTGVYNQYLVVIVGSQTMGGGEIVAAAIKAHNRRALLVGKFLTAGKGMSQTYFPAGNNLMVRLTTGFYLQPDGSDIEDARVHPTIGVAPAGDVDAAAKEVMQTMLNKVPRPELPGK